VVIKLGTNMQSPLDILLTIFSTQAELARFLGLTQSVVSKWRHNSNGQFPAKHYKPLLEEAKRRKKRLTPNDLVLGRKD
jgi:predicted transcriptional regulator